MTIKIKVDKPTAAAIRKICKKFNWSHSQFVMRCVRTFFKMALKTEGAFDIEIEK
jgi:hypothetical protein